MSQTESQSQAPQQETPQETAPSGTDFFFVGNEKKITILFLGQKNTSLFPNEEAEKQCLNNLTEGFLQNLYKPLETMQKELSDLE